MSPFSKYVSKPASQATRITFEPWVFIGQRGKELMRTAALNKGSAFTMREREEFDLTALLPPSVNTLDDQVARARSQFLQLETPILRNQFMMSMRRQNETLYFALVAKYLRETMGIIYTPTQGEAIEKYSHLFREPTGCFLNIHDPDRISHHLSHWGSAHDIDYIVVTDGEAILGIGDQGVGGVEISVAKLALMTACGGVHPDRVIPVVWDVGTDRKEYLEDPLYMGNRHPRIRGKQYEDFVAKFMSVIKKQYPDSILHLEDFGTANGYSILSNYQDKLPVWDDDIQGTGMVTLATVRSALLAAKQDLKDAKIVIFGAGSAGMGIANQLVENMIATDGVSAEEAHSNVYLVDRDGLITSDMELRPGQGPYARDPKEFKGSETKTLLDVVKEVHPTILVGCSGQAGAFSEEVVKEMASHVERPVILPLSNPTRLHEQTPANLIKWTDGKVLVATGSPFEPVDGREISENNNCYTFPGLGFGAVAARATKISKGMLAAASNELATLSPVRHDPTAPLLPPLEDIREISAKVASAVVLQAKKEGLARISELDTIYGDDPVVIPDEYEERLEWVKSQMWRPEYRRFVRAATF